ncbi:transcription antitermination factor NusB [Flavobacterium sp.]|uniref:transcription antitermination factor NusB n=1 Tax=Flavobacterium sp. TaxID=239 RepID=UPI0026096032|nr:transcription antitermination factor NusB [Flavobacterium sp.]
MQTIYAMHQSGSDDLSKQEKFLKASLDNILDLYLILLSSLVELRKKEEAYLELAKNKHLATKEERNPNTRFIHNPVLLALEKNASLQNALATNHIHNWQHNDDTIIYMLQDVKNSTLYQKYMAKPAVTFEDERYFVTDLFTEVIAPNEKLYAYLEDFKLTWVDDIPVVNTLIQKQLRHFVTEEFCVPKIFKDEEDADFALDLLRKTILNESLFGSEFENKTPNWDTERIAELDTIMLKMAICEFLKFPSIPVKVTINEYLELAKEYSTPKSSIFINGILDNLVKEYQISGKMKKAGRGLL